jgi:hypothetical protein
LFSHDDVARFVNRSFEPVWVSVRPVPLVRIDFGHQVVLTRTLNGNIATSVCNADGQVLDILPGIYTPDVYLDRLNQLRLLANYVGQVQSDKRQARVREYHRDQADALAHQKVPARFINAAAMAKRAIEGGLKAMLVPGNTPVVGPSDVPRVQQARGSMLESREDVANWKELVEDTRINESVRRRQIHDMLGEAGLVAPERITKRLYKEVLHADLDDPYLGLGATLFANYPFKGEDEAH